MIFKTRQAAGFGFTLLLGGLLGSATAQGIYTCVDEKGRKLTSDRPIAECMERVQFELNPSGTVRRVLTPPPTAKDRIAAEEKEKADSKVRRQQAEESLRNRALMARYPDRASHDKERAAALELANDAIKTAIKRAQVLADQRKAIGAEQDFYKSSPGKEPPTIKLRLDETDVNIATQNRLIADQEAEKKRVVERFDTEMVKLKPQWREAQTPVATGPASSAKKP